MFPTHIAVRLTLLAMCLLPLSLAAQVMSGSATNPVESTVYEDQAGANGGGYPAVCIGNVGDAGATRRGYVRYSLPDIPEGATITRVVYEVDQNRVRNQGDGSPKTASLRVRRVTSDWEEGIEAPQNRACGGGTNGPGVTWNSTPTNDNTISARADLPAAGSTTITMDTDVGNENDGLIDDVQAWVDGEPNYGWQLRVSEEGTADNARLINLPNFTIEWTEGAQGFVINAGINDAWFNPDTNGQGFFIIVFPDIPLVFFAWFTYDTERPPEDVEAILGDPGHRWITAQGPFEGDTAVLDLVITRGGIFNSGEPEPENEIDGTITIIFESCTAGVVQYDIPSLGLMGEVPIQRIANDNVPLCEELAAGG